MAGQRADARKRAEEEAQPMFVLREAERLSLRGRVRDALDEVYAGAGDIETAALIDQLDDRGLRIVEAGS